MNNKTFVSSAESVPVLFLDWDGTIRLSRSGKTFINNCADIALFDGVEEKIWEWKRRGFYVAGITNQGGVAFGFKSESDWEKEMEATFSLFTENPFDQVEYCFFHPNGTVKKYAKESTYRKPDIGMVSNVAMALGLMNQSIDWASSLFVGDRSEDRLCAKNAGIEFRWAWDFFDGVPNPDSN